MTDNNDSESRNGIVTVKIGKDELEASVLITEPVGSGSPVSFDMAKQELERMGVKHGIDLDLLRNIINDHEYDTDIVVANGSPAVDGKDAYVKYFFDTVVEAKPQEDDKGNVDYKNINLLQNVTNGQTLAELIPPTPGQEGKTVTGKQILPKVGKMLKMPSGINTEISKDNQNILIATTNGNVYHHRGALIQVDPVYIVNSDVDFSTGNIDYIGTLIIKGNVKAGFEIKSQSDLEINGLVEDAIIKAGGNILIKNGFLGRGEGLIECDGKVYLKYCENQTIKAKGDIIVGEAVLNSDLTSDSRIEVTGQKGVIVGGKTFARKGVSVKELGNYQENRTEVVAGIDMGLMKAIEEADNELQKSGANIENVKKAIYKLVKKKMEVKTLPPEQANLLSKLQELQGILPAQNQQLEEKKQGIENELKKYEAVTIEVISKVYPGVKVQIQKYKKVITKEMSSVVFKIEAGEIQVFNR